MIGFMGDEARRPWLIQACRRSRLTGAQVRAFLENDYRWASDAKTSSALVDKTTFRKTIYDAGLTTLKTSFWLAVSRAGLLTIVPSTRRTPVA